MKDIQHYGYYFPATACAVTTTYGANEDDSLDDVNNADDIVEMAAAPTHIHFIIPSIHVLYIMVVVFTTIYSDTPLPTSNVRSKKLKETAKRQAKFIEEVYLIELIEDVSASFSKPDERRSFENHQTSRIAIHPIANELVAARIVTQVQSKLDLCLPQNPIITPEGKPLTKTYINGESDYSLTKNVAAQVSVSQIVFVLQHMATLSKKTGFDSKIIVYAAGFNITTAMMEKKG
uniref:Uncharacterized protein n=1 Tax=Glossina palpalis gambiensis TaxID=67801 RepID=A0A1B0ATV9_9MUSC